MLEISGKFQKWELSRKIKISIKIMKWQDRQIQLYIPRCFYLYENDFYGYKRKVTLHSTMFLLIPVVYSSLQYRYNLTTFCQSCHFIIFKSRQEKWLDKEFWGRKDDLTSFILWLSTSDRVKTSGGRQCLRYQENFKNESCLER